MELKLSGKVIGLSKTEKVNSEGDNVETYKATLKFNGEDYTIKLTLTTEEYDITEDFTLNEEFLLTLKPANRSLTDFEA
ncbi:MAG: hypothetical protein H0Z28_10115 [Archaeoglobus sp.]|nr:hypothetical protein [Archaeoglobus sp.]